MDSPEPGFSICSQFKSRLALSLVSQAADIAGLRAMAHVLLAFEDVQSSNSRAYGATLAEKDGVSGANCERDELNLTRLTMITLLGEAKKQIGWTEQEATSAATAQPAQTSCIRHPPAVTFSRSTDEVKALAAKIRMPAESFETSNPPSSSTSRCPTAECLAQQFVAAIGQVPGPLQVFSAAKFCVAEWRIGVSRLGKERQIVSHQIPVRTSSSTDESMFVVILRHVKQGKGQVSQMEIKCQQVQNPNASFWISFRVTVGSRTHSGCHDFANNCVARLRDPRTGSPQSWNLHANQDCTPKF